VSTLTQSGKRLLLIGLAVTGFAIIAGAASLIPIYEWYRLSQLQDHGVNVPARVTKGEVDITKRHAEEVIRYEYQVEGEMNQRSGVVRISHRRMSGQNYFETLRPFLENNARVKYLANDPGFHCVEHMLPDRVANARLNTAMYVAFALLLGVVGLILVGTGLFRRRKSRRRE
jgi:hypothetical protein